MTEENYCFKCGKFTRINTQSKLCEPCTEAWFKKGEGDGRPDRILRIVRSSAV